MRAESEGALTSVRFESRWLDSKPTGDIADATFAELSITVGTATVTSVLETTPQGRRTRYRDHVVVPLLSVAEWLVSNWWHLWYEVADTRYPRPDFETRHDLAHAGEGFLLPRLTMFPNADRIHLQWSNWKPRHARTEFIGEGQAVVGRQELESEFRALIEAVLTRLRGIPRGTEVCEFLNSDWEAINSLAEDEVEFVQAAALLGIDPFDVQGSVADAVVEFWETSQPSIRQEVLASADEESLSSVGKWLQDSLVRLEQSDHGTDWATVREAACAEPSGTPWARGSALADRVRCHLGTGEGKFEFDASGSLALPNLPLQPPCKRIQGLVASNAPTCVLAPSSRETSKRFLLARALGDYVGRSEAGPGILSSIATDRQAQSRAFAAQFLAPADSIRARLEDGHHEEGTIDEIGFEFGVSSEVIRRQIDNHQLAGRQADTVFFH